MTTNSSEHGVHDLSLLDALVQVSFDVIGTISQIASAHDLSLTQLRVLAILRNHEPTMSELADYLGLDRSSVTGLIDRASERGLTQRIANPADRRSARVGLTEAGRALAAEGAAEIAAGVAPLLERLTASEQEHLAGLLRRMR